MSTTNLPDVPTRADGIHIEDLKYVVASIGRPSRIYSFHLSEDAAAANLPSAVANGEGRSYEVMTWDAYYDADKAFRKANPEINARGNRILRDSDADEALGIRRGSDRYYYDFKALPTSKWQQFDTTQDASYFGVWVNVSEFQIFTYAEGDRTLVVCADAAHLQAELDDAVRFYGPPPPFAVSFDDKGQRTDHYDVRPTVEVAA